MEISEESLISFEVMNYINGMEYVCNKMRVRQTHRSLRPYLSYFGLEGQGGGGGVGTTTALIFAMVSHLPGLVPDMSNECITGLVHNRYDYVLLGCGTVNIHSFRDLCDRFGSRTIMRSPWPSRRHGNPPLEHYSAAPHGFQFAGSLFCVVGKYLTGVAGTR